MSKKKILIADDDADLLELLSMLLSVQGYEVTTLYQGGDILQVEREQLPNLLLLDIGMSGVDGEYICQELKRSEKSRYMPIIIFSANASIEQIAHTCGADAYLAKPFEIQELVILIHRGKRYIHWPC